MANSINENPQSNSAASAKASKKKIIITVSVILAAVALITAAVLITVALLKRGDNPLPTVPEGVAGTYYTVGGKKSELTLKENGEFIFLFGELSLSGQFALDGKTLTLDFDKEGQDNVTADYENETVTLTFDGAALRLIKKIEYTVKFETDGGSPVADVKVMNGQTLAKPNDPEKENYLFVGWYKDASFKEPYTFSSDVITSDTTVYARWTAATGAPERTVSFDLGYTDGEAPSPMTTLGGRIFGAPVPEREGFSFLGWWISTDNDAAKPSYKMTEDTVFDTDTVLYALWRESGSDKIEPPSLKVTESGISWASVSGARSYQVTLTNADGVTLISRSVTSTNIGVVFADYEAGVYSIKVTANANTGDSDSSQAYFTYVNKGLDKVKDMFISDGNMLVYSGVENAEKYLVTVVCGNSEHNHKDFDNGSSKTFSFANCPMSEGGIKFTVKAIAEGYLTSVSDELVYSPKLTVTEGFDWNEDSSVLTWTPTENADFYMVSVLCANHSAEFFRSDSTSLNLGEFIGIQGEITVRVYPVSEKYISPEPAEIKLTKANMKTPSSIKLTGTLLSWEAVENATGYEISVNGTTHTASQNSLDLSEIAIGDGVYEIALRTLGSAPSAWSTSLKCYKSKIDGGVSYSDGYLFWNPVIGADFYEIRVNEGEIITPISNTCAKIPLSKAGENVIELRFVSGSERSEWTSVTVNAFEVIFDTLGGEYVNKIFAAAGDRLELPETARIGYKFVSWYNVPGGPSVSGKEIDERFFKVTENITLYAHYSPEKYEITYNYGTGGTGLGVAGSVEFERDYVLEVPTANELTVSFGGWFEHPHGKGTQYTDASGKSLVPWNTVGGKELHAFWIDETLVFTSVKVGDKDAYSVSVGPRIALVAEVTVPAYHNGLPVAMVDGGAFAGCGTLRAINLPSTLEVISSLDPFSDCVSLTDINVYREGNRASGRYSSEDGVLFENKSEGKALLRMPMARVGAYTVPDGTAEISEGAFRDSALESTVISPDVLKIRNDAFSGAAKLKSVSFAAPKQGAEKELTVGKRAFAGCVSLVNITLPSRLAEIELGKYYLNTKGEFTESGDFAFAGCTSLNSIGVAEGSSKYRVVDGMIYSSDTLIYCPVARSGALTVPVGTAAIGAGAFVGCDGITEIVIPNSVTYIGEYAFSGISLSKLTFLGKGFGSVTVGDRAFSGCAELSEVIFEAGSQISVIGEGAFAGCTSLSEFTITSSVTSIRDNALEGCTALESVTFEGGKKALEFGKNVFKDCTNLTTVNIPKNVSAIPGIFSGCASLTEVKVDGDNPHFLSDGGVVFNKDKTEIVYYPEGRGGEYRIPESVRSIAAGVFAFNKSIDRLVIPLSVSYIGEDAFKATDIGRIVFEGGSPADELIIAKSAFEKARFEGYDFTLPSHTKSIGDYAFAEIFYQKIVLNEGLLSLGSHAFYNPSNTDGAALVIPASVKFIGEYCFSGETLQNSYVTAHCFMDVEFAAGESALTEICDYAFYKNVRITAAHLPSSVVRIGNYAFYQCTALSELTLSASLEEIGAYAFAASSSSYLVPISTLIIPADVSKIGARAFENCQLLTTVTFMGTKDSPDLSLGTAYLREYESDGVEMFSIERGNVFASCTRLSEVNLSANVVSLGDYCFANTGNASLSDTGFRVNLPDDSRLASIGAFCFYKSALESFTVPATVRNLDPVEEYGTLYNRLGIGDYAFAVSVGKLTEITFLKDSNSYPLTIGYGAFENQSKLVAIELPARLCSYVAADGAVISPLAGGATLFYGARSLSALTAEAGGAYKVEGGVLYTSDMKELVFCPMSLVESISVPGTVTKIHAYAFTGCSGITSVSFIGKSGLTMIGDYAFYGCSSIDSLMLPAGVATVGEKAFANATSLVSITLPERLERFDVTVLDGCTALENIYVGMGNKALASENGVLYSADKSLLILYPEGRKDKQYTVNTVAVLIGNGAFKNNGNIELVLLPSGLKEIGENAFIGCSSLNTVLIPASVETIGDSAFAYTSALENLSFAMGGDKKLVIGIGAFSSAAVSSLRLPARLAYIGSDAFKGSRLASVGFEEANSYQLSEIGAYAFAYTLLSSVEFPDGVVTVGDGAFLGTAKLESAVFGEGLISVGTEAFKDSSVKTASFPASLKTLGSYAFSCCYRLGSVSFTSGSQLESVSASCFLNCTSLRTITLPYFVKEISGVRNGGAFEGCTALSRVIFESDDYCTLIGDYAFYGCSALDSFDIPLTVGTLGNYAFSGCSSLSEITLHRGTVKLGEGLFSGCTSLSEVEMSTGSDRLPARMFENCASLTELFIPSGITEIADKCFLGSGIESFEIAKENRSFISVNGIIYNSSKTAIVCLPPRFSATTLVIPKEVVSISNGNFQYCTSIREVIFEECGTAPLSIGNYAFDGCYQIRRVVLPERLISIGSYAFRECYGLNSITIPKNVSKIGDAAFSKCFKLYEVYNNSAIEKIPGDTYLNAINLNALVGAKVNVIKNGEGSSVIFREGDFAFTTVGGTKRLIGYYGNDSVITLPEGEYEVASYMFSHDSSVTKVTVPEGVSLNGSFMFEECDNLEAILLMADSLPDSLDKLWNNGKPYFTGYTGESISYTFNTNGAPAISPISSIDPITLPVPKYDGYVFMGWYDNPELTGEVLPDYYYSSEKTALYASYMEEKEYIESFLRGQSMEYAYGVNGAKTYTVDVRAKGAQNYFSLTVEAGESWNILTLSGYGYHKLWIYDGDGNLLATYVSNTQNQGYEIYYDHLFEDSGTYYIGIGYRDPEHAPGSFEVTFTKKR